MHGCRVGAKQITLEESGRVCGYGKPEDAEVSGSPDGFSRQALMQSKRYGEDTNKIIAQFGIEIGKIRFFHVQIPLSFRSAIIVSLKHPLPLVVFGQPEGKIR